MSKFIVIPKPDDFHVHLRQGSMLEAMVPLTARYFGRALIMPNLSPPILRGQLRGQELRDYRAKIMHLVETQKNPSDRKFHPLMTFKITDETHRPPSPRCSTLTLTPASSIWPM